jgi:hypothetical protein
MLALQCTLRADTCGRARLSTGLLRSMRLRGRTEIREELAHGDWLQPPDLRSTPVEVQLLDATVQEQIPAEAHAAAPPTGRCTPRRWACQLPLLTRCS